MLADEPYVSVDVETSGPVPGRRSLPSIGLCLVSEPAQVNLEFELQPDGTEYDPEALANWP